MSSKPLPAERLRAEEPALITSLDFGPFVAQGCGDGPSLIIGDGSEISLSVTAPDRVLEHRMSLLAKPGDVVLVRRRDRAFEAYLADCLGLCGITFLELGPPPGQAPADASIRAVADLARHAPALIERLAALAVRGGGLTIKAYLTTGRDWRLAQVIGEAARRVVHVCGPSPRATRRVNDKLWFTSLAKAVIGQDATPPTLSAFGPAATAALVAHTAKTAARVVVKVPDSAGSAGNISLPAPDIRAMGLADLREFLMTRLHGVGWQDTYPVLVGVWEADVLCSPSAQLWIPHASDGPPVCRAIFEQSVMGDVGRFVGAHRTTLPDTVQADLSAQALRMASVLQQVGYFGACSFDAVIRHAPTGPAVIHWIECNGRWGGVSIPLAAVAGRMERAGCTGDLPAGCVIVQERVSGIHLTTSDLVACLRDLLAGPDGHGLILTAPAQGRDGTVLSAVAVAQSASEARAMIDAAMARLRRLVRDARP